MVTLVSTTSFNGDWPPDTLQGGTIISRTATAMSYVSEMGYTVTFRGRGLVYDDTGAPSGGLMTGVAIAKVGTIFATYSGVSVDFGRAGMLAFGYDRDNGRVQNPDGYALVQTMLRGNDSLTGSSGDDDLRGGAGNDTFNSGAGRDFIGDEAGNDSYNGGDDWDTLSFDEANYRPDAFRGINLDALTGVAKDCFGFTDHFTGFEQYRDSLFNDTMRGSNIAEETFTINRGNDLVDGRGGFDWADYRDADRWGAHRGVSVNLGTGIAVDSWKGRDHLSNIEGVRGTIFNDILIGTARDEVFESGAGKDVVNMGGGFDELKFSSVGDRLPGHGIVINFSALKNIVDDGYGNTENALGVERITGSRLDDLMTGNNAMNRFNGNDGNDTLNGGGGEDNLQGEWGRDRIFGGTGNDHISGGGDNDTLTGNAGGDQFNFDWNLNDAGVDTITDFEVGIDNIWIASSWGGGFVSDTLTANQFRSGAGVTSANADAQRVIYDTTTGDLYFDADGVGGTPAVRFAVLSNQAALTFQDFNVFL